MILGVQQGWSIETTQGLPRLGTQVGFRAKFVTVIGAPFEHWSMYTLDVNLLLGRGPCRVRCRIGCFSLVRIELRS